jgi:hypothetical protein
MNCFDKVVIELQWVALYIWWVATHATCPLTLMVYKYNELQVSEVIQNLNCKTICKHHCFSCFNVEVKGSNPHNFQLFKCV